MSLRFETRQAQSIATSSSQSHVPPLFSDSLQMLSACPTWSLLVLLSLSAMPFQVDTTFLCLLNFDPLTSTRWRWSCPSKYPNSKHQKNNCQRSTNLYKHYSIRMHCGIEKHLHFLPQICLPLHFNTAWDSMERKQGFKAGQFVHSFWKSFPDCLILYCLIDWVRIVSGV